MPTKSPRSVALALLLVTLAACRPPGPSPAPPPPTIPNRLVQVSVINALMLGQYEGVLPIPELLKLGDFGLGTLDHLDGELIVLDGQAYQARANGTVHPVAPDRSTPFAAVTHFRPTGEFPCPRLDSLADLDAHITRNLPQPNAFLAIRVDGQFPTLTLRSVPAQKPPYAPLSEVSKTQSVHTLANIRGTLVGIRGPSWAQGLNVPGFHWHFLAADHQAGGHVLDCHIAADAIARHATCQEWLIHIPNTPTFQQANLAQDLARDLHRVESSREPAPSSKTTPR